MRTAAAAVVAVLAATPLLTGCGDTGADGQPADRPTAGTRPDRPPALTGFSCSPRDDGSWWAVGTVTNTGYRRAGFRVTVAVTRPGDRTVRAARQRVGLAPGDSVDLRFRRVPAPPYRADLTCQAHVARATPR